MKYLFYALKEHWQIYVGLLLGLIIGLLVGVGFTDWKSLVKGFDSKVTDWISSLSTLFGIVVAIIGFNNWRKEKKSDLERELFKDLINFNKDIYLVRLKYTELKNDINQFNEICDFINNQLNISFNNIRASVRFYLYFTKKEKNNEDIDIRQFTETIIDPLYNELHALHYEVGRCIKTTSIIPIRSFKDPKNKIISLLESGHESINKILILFEDGSS